MGAGGATAKLRKAARKMVMAAACASPSLLHPPDSQASSMNTSKHQDNSIHTADDSTSKQNLCAICLEALSYSTGEAIFTAQCSHSFHFSCISSNVRHGSLTCPICRSHWTQLPRNIYPPHSVLSFNTHNDPVFRILDDSIATFRFHRRSFLRSARYHDDDPIDPHNYSHDYYPCLDFSLIPIPPTLLSHSCCFHNHHTSASPPSSVDVYGRCRAAYLSVKLTNPQPIDLVLVASPCGPHLRLLKQSMALVAFSLRPVDRLAIVTYPSAAAPVFPLRRMTSCGKRAALQVIDRIELYMGEAEAASEGLRKGMKILEDRAYKNPQCSILHMLDSHSSARSYQGNTGIVGVHRFQVVYGTGMREVEEFLGKVLGGVARDIQIRIGEEGKILSIGELRGGEERRFILEVEEVGEHVEVPVGYSCYVDGCTPTRIRGETVVRLADNSKPHEHAVRRSSTTDSNSNSSSSSSSSSSHDPFMARRWAKRLHLHHHGYRL